jgi:hypothetical protein
VSGQFGMSRLQLIQMMDAMKKKHKLKIDLNLLPGLAGWD